MRFNYDRLQLNKILISQALSKNNNVFNKELLLKMQRSDPVFRELLTTLTNTQEPNTKGFQLLNGLLYRQATSFGQHYLRLCIPPEICKDIVFHMHHLHNMHFSAHTTQVLYSVNFYTWGANLIIQTICNNCSVCLLYSSKYTRKYLGLNRTFGQNTNVGEILYADIAYLHLVSLSN